jgi:hypothetical protein
MVALANAAVNGRGHLKSWVKFSFFALHGRGSSEPTSWFCPIAPIARLKWGERAGVGTTGRLGRPADHQFFQVGCLCPTREMRYVCWVMGVRPSGRNWTGEWSRRESRNARSRIGRRPALPSSALSPRPRLARRRSRRLPCPMARQAKLRPGGRMRNGARPNAAPRARRGPGSPPTTMPPPSAA